MTNGPFRILLCDIGGVLGTNGWDSALRKRVCQHFNLDPDYIQSRHRLLFDSFERGYMSFDEYLQTVFFAESRPFTLQQVREFAFAGSEAWERNIQFLGAVRRSNTLKVGLISNEGEGITAHRVEKFRLREIADFMVISHFTHLRKPDPEIWRLALNLGATKSSEALYIDDRAMFAEVASDLGLIGLHYTSLPKLRQDLADLGLQIEAEPDSHPAP